MKKFDLFRYLGQKDNEEATTYQCGYYVINKYTNKLDTDEVTDTFYTFIDNSLLKFDMIQGYETQYFNVYEVKTFKDKDWWKIDSLMLSHEDINEDIIPRLLDLDSYDPLDLAEVDDDLIKYLEEYEKSID